MATEYEIVKDCKTAGEAIAKSKFKLGQLARVVKLTAHGSIQGNGRVDWTVHPEFELIPDGTNPQLWEKINRAQG